MSLNRNLTRTLLTGAVALGTLGFSSAAFAATGSHAASAATSSPEYTGGRVLTRTLGPEYEGGRVVTRTFGPGYDGGRVVTRTSGPSYEGGRVAVAKAHGHKIVPFAHGAQPRVHMNPPEYDGG